MASPTLTADQKAQLTAAGFDITKLLAWLAAAGQAAPGILALILQLVAVFTPAVGKTKMAHAPKGTSACCDCCLDTFVAACNTVQVASTMLNCPCE